MSAELSRLVEFHKALAHPARLRILAMLRAGELCVCQITAALALAPSTVSAHLGDLRRAGLLEERKDGRWVHYGLARSAPANKLLQVIWPELERDPQVEADGAVVAALRDVSVDELCRANLDLEELGLERPTVASNARGEAK
jgi:ArsR family transcriptional regulator, arsenate/arsenite/antimonite-responsive transcriptional repressor